MSDGGEESLAVKVGRLDERLKNAEKITDAVTAVDKKVDALSDKISEYQNKLTVAVGLFMGVVAIILALPSLAAALKTVLR